jgi:hypothetical protein
MTPVQGFSKFTAATEVADNYASPGTAARIVDRIPTLNDISVVGAPVSADLGPTERITLTIAQDYTGHCIALWFPRATSRVTGCTLLASSPTPPSREFPYAKHLNLLGLPEVEGVFCDPDEFIDR